MSDFIYASKSRIERKKGLLRIAYVAGEPRPVEPGMKRTTHRDE